MLVAMVPFLTMAQKRSNKAKASKANVEYMMIKGVEVPEDFNMDSREKEEYIEEMRMEGGQKNRLHVSFDFGGVNSKMSTDLIRSAAEFRTIMEVVNSAVERGWELVSINSLSHNGLTTHYCYMRMNK